MTSQDDLALLKQMYQRGEISDEQYDVLRRHVLWGTPLPQLMDEVPSARRGDTPPAAVPSPRLNSDVPTRYSTTPDRHGADSRATPAAGPDRHAGDPRVTSGAGSDRYGAAPSAGSDRYGAAPSAGSDRYGAAPSAGSDRYGAAPSAGPERFGAGPVDPGRYRSEPSGSGMSGAPAEGSRQVRREAAEAAGYPPAHPPPTGPPAPVARTGYLPGAEPPRTRQARREARGAADYSPPAHLPAPDGPAHPPAYPPPDGAPVYLPPNGAPAYPPPGDASAHVPPNSASAYAPPGDAPAYAPPNGASAYVPPGDASAHVPPNSASAYAPPGDAPVYAPPNGASAYVPPGDAPAPAPPGDVPRSRRQRREAAERSAAPSPETLPPPAGGIRDSGFGPGTYAPSAHRAPTGPTPVGAQPVGFLPPTVPPTVLPQGDRPRSAERRAGEASPRELPEHPPDELQPRRARRAAEAEPAEETPRRGRSRSRDDDPGRGATRADGPVVTARRRRSVVAVLTSVVLALALAAGGVWWFTLRNAGVSPADYAQSICGSVRDWQQSVDSSNSTLVTSIAREQDRTAVRTAVTAYYSSIAGRTDQLRASILNAGIADVAGGQAYSDSLAAAVGDEATGLRGLSSKAAGLDPAAAATFQIELQSLLTGSGTAVGNVSSALARPRAGTPTVLRAALSAEPACAPYVG